MFEALVATAVGLFVAIPAVVAFNLFQRRVRKRMAQVDSLAHLMLANGSIERRPRRADGAGRRRTRGSRNGWQHLFRLFDDDDDVRR